LRFWIDLKSLWTFSSSFFVEIFFFFCDYLRRVTHYGRDAERREVRRVAATSTLDV
jgi:hypothetical protein